MSDSHDQARLRAMAEAQARSIEGKSSNKDPEVLNHELMVHQIELTMQNEQLMDEQQRAKSLLGQVNALLHQSPVAFAVIDIKGRIQECNETLCRWVGHECSNLNGSYIFNLFQGEEEHRFRSVFQKLVREPGKFEVEIRLVTEGELENRIVLIQSSTLERFGRDHDEQLLVLSFSDISQHIRVRSTIDLASQVLKHTQECIIITDSNSRILDVNPAFCKVTGYEREEVLGKRPSVLASGKHDRHFYERMWQGLREQGFWRGRVVNRKKSGEEYVEELVIHVVDEHDQPAYYIGIFYDVSEHMRAEEALRKAQRLEAVGTLASGVAHNFNNMLAGITGNIYLAMMDDTLSPETRKRLESAEKVADGAADLIRQLLSFAKQNQKKEMTIELNDYISEFLESHKGHIPEHIAFEFHRDEGTSHIHCDVVQLEQVLLNIVINAVHALADTAEPRIILSVQRDALGDEHASQVLLSLQDNGCGIPEEIRDRVFEPFFTTKGSTKGTGLGLATAYGTITSMGGYIDLMSTPGKGTSFHIYLPTVDMKKQQSQQVQPEDERAGSNEMASHNTILVVDDNENLREIVCDVLQARGYRVLEAADGEEGLLLAASHPVSLVLTDSVMPRMNGIVMARKLRATQPSLPIVVMSGYSEEMMQDKAEEMDLPFIHKPFKPEEILKLVRQLTS